jgi:K+-sensing histidine kinase KdpD
MKSTTNDRVSFTNNIEDFKDMKVDLTLFGFILCKFLLLVPSFCDAGEEIKINAVNYEKNIIVSISGNEKSLYNRFGESCLISTVSRVESISVDTNSTLKLCYDILAFYGGNLWSESSEQEGLKLYFSMPVNKNR